MSDDLETVEDTRKGSLAEVTDDSCTLDFAEIFSLTRPSDDYHTSEFIYPLVEVKPEDLQEMKQEPADENDNSNSHYYVKQEPVDEYEIESSCFPVQVCSVCRYSACYCITGVMICFCLTLSLIACLSNVALCVLDIVASNQ